MKSIIAEETKITKIEYNDFQAIFFTSIISQIPRIANIVKNNVRVANNTEMPFLNIGLNFKMFIQK